MARATRSRGTALASANSASCSTPARPCSSARWSAVRTSTWAAGSRIRQSTQCPSRARHHLPRGRGSSPVRSLHVRVARSGLEQRDVRGLALERRRRRFAERRATPRVRHARRTDRADRIALPLVARQGRQRVVVGSAETIRIAAAACRAREVGERFVGREVTTNSVHLAEDGAGSARAAVGGVAEEALAALDRLRYREIRRSPCRTPRRKQAWRAAA